MGRTKSTPVKRTATTDYTFNINDSTQIQQVLNDSDNHTNNTLHDIVHQYESITQHDAQQPFNVDQLLELVPGRKRLRRQTDTNNTHESNTSKQKRKQTNPTSSKKSLKQTITTAILSSSSDDSDYNDDDDMIDHNTKNELDHILHEFEQRVVTSDSDVEQINSFTRRKSLQRKLTRTIRKPDIFRQYSTSIPIGSLCIRREGIVHINENELNQPLEIQFINQYDNDTTTQQVILTQSQFLLFDNSHQHSSSDSDDSVIDMTNDSDNNTQTQYIDHNTRCVSDLIVYTPISIVQTHRTDNSIDQYTLDCIVQLYAKGLITLCAQYLSNQQIFHVTIYLTQTTLLTSHQLSNTLKQQLKHLVIEWCCQLSTVQLNTSIDENNDTVVPNKTDVHSIYSSALPPSNYKPQLKHDITQDELAELGLVPTLLSYQATVLQWLIERETNTNGTVLINKHHQPTHEATIYWKTIALPSLNDIKQTASYIHTATVDKNILNQRAIQYNRITAQFVSANVDVNDIEQINDVHGGILAEEMGLGKTVETIALLLAQRADSLTLFKQQQHMIQQLVENSNTHKNSDEIQCYCGVDHSFSGGKFIQCEMCDLWQHSTCVGYTASVTAADTTVYVCPNCIKQSNIKLPLKATLIVCPDVLLQQWKSELELHTRSDTLKVLLYTGVRQQNTQLHSSAKPKHSAVVDEIVVPETVYDNSLDEADGDYKPTKRKPKKPRTPKIPLAANGYVPFDITRVTQLSEYDVILTTYTTLSADLYHTDYITSDRSQRYRKRFRTLPTPLISAEFYRIVMDESQFYSSGSTRAAQCMNQLTGLRKWCVSGTPISKSLDDLYGSLLFLQCTPYNDKHYFKHYIQQPYEQHNPYAVRKLHGLISRIMWRNTKSSIANQLTIPALNQHVYTLDLTPVERYNYNKRRDECIERTAVLRSKSSKQLTDNQRKVIFNALLQLRQTCIHPQIGSNTGFERIQKQTLTMKQLTSELLDNARIQCEEQQRLMYAAMFGLAALDLLQQRYDTAIVLYEEVLMIDSNANNIDEIHTRDVRIDPLQRIHALYNLSEALIYKSEDTENNDVKPLFVQQRVKQLLDAVEQLKKEFLIQPNSDMLQAENECKQARDTAEQYIHQLTRTHALNWYHKAIQHIQKQSVPTQTVRNRLEVLLLDRLVAELKSIASANQDSKAKSMTTVATNLHSLHDVRYILDSMSESLYATRERLLTKFDIVSAQVSATNEQLINESMRCKQCHYDGTVAICTHCKIRPLLQEYQLQLYRFRITGKAAEGYGFMRGASKVGDQKLLLDVDTGERLTRKERQKLLSSNNIPIDTDMLLTDSVETARSGMIDSEFESVCKIIANFMRTNKDNDELMTQYTELAQQYNKQFELLKKEYNKLSALWIAQHEYIGFVGELQQSTTRVRLKQPNEQIDKLIENSVVELHEIDERRALNYSDRTKAYMLLTQNLSKLRFLQQQLTQHGQNNSTDDQSSTNLCSICQSTDLSKVQQFVLLICGHTYCQQCINTLIKTKEQNPNHNYTLKCPNCRYLCKKRDIHYVKNDLLQSIKPSTSTNSITQVKLEPSNTTTTVHNSSIAIIQQRKLNGSYGTKIDFLVRKVSDILENKDSNNDKETKILIFSEFYDALSLVSRALTQNHILHLTLNNNKNKQILQQFKTSTAVHVLLLSLTQNNAGLNITEANHIIFVEPTLNKAKRVQAIGRIYRMNQAQQSHVHDIVINNTVETNIHTLNNHSNVDTVEYTTKNAKIESLLSKQQLNELFNSDNTVLPDSIHYSSNETYVIDDDTNDVDTQYMNDVQEEIDLQNELHTTSANNAQYWDTTVLYNNQSVTRHVVTVLQRNRYLNRKLNSPNNTQSSTDTVNHTHSGTVVHMGQLLPIDVVEQLQQYEVVEDDDM